MAGRSRLRSRRSPSAGAQVAVVAIALIAYLLLPVVHATHHLLDHQKAGIALSADGTTHTHDCRGFGCRPVPPLSPAEEPGDDPHDHSSCDICQALYAARKNVGLPAPEITTITAGPRHVHTTLAVHEAHADTRPLPRTSRGPPQLA